MAIYGARDPFPIPFHPLYNPWLDYDFMHASLFMTRESGVDLAHLRNVDDIPHLQPEIIAATKEKPCKEQYLLTLFGNIVSDIGHSDYTGISQYGLEYYPDNYVYAEALDGLTAVPGHDFLIQLPGTAKGKDVHDGSSDDSNDEYESMDLHSYCRLWKKQATPLTKLKQYDVLLVPKRLLFIRQSKGQLELLNYIVIGCGLQPLNLCVHASHLCQADGNLRMQYSADEDNRLYLKSLLSKVVVLSLERVTATCKQTGTLQYVFETVVQNGTLKALEISSESISRLDLGFLSPYLFALPRDPPSLPRYQGLSVLEIGSPLEPTSLPQLTALVEQQHMLKHVYIILSFRLMSRSI